MADMIRSSLSGVLAFQRALGTTSNNISNSQTEGYNRQSVTMNARAETSGGRFSGAGVYVSSVDRNFNPFVEEQLNATQSEFSSLDTYYDFAARVTNLIADPDLGLTQTFNDFFAAVEELSNDPSSVPVRQFVIEQGNLLSDSFMTFQGQLESLDKEINAQLESLAGQVNIITDEVSELNGLIATAYGRNPNTSPNELLDQRDDAVGRLNQLLSVKTINKSDGTIDVFIPNGQPLVLGNVASELSTTTSEFTPERIELVVNNTSGISLEISDKINGGQLGGLLDARTETVDKAKREIGLLATGLHQSFNEQHALGMTLDGNLGEAFFNLNQPEVRASKTNVGSGFIDVSVSDAGQLDSENYIFTFDGTSHILFNEDTGAVTPMSGDGSATTPFMAKGLSIELTNPIATGDRIQILGYGNAGSLNVAIDNVNDIAAQSALNAAYTISNLGEAKISDVEIADINNPNLLDPVTITFTSTSTFDVTNNNTLVTTSHNYNDGAIFSHNGWEVVISDTAQIGDEFTIVPNTSGSSNNRNALALSSVDTKNVFSNGTVSLNDRTDAIIGDYANSTRRAELSRNAKQAIFEKVTAEKESISGVNLDEEAANLLRFQQAYQASAQGISAANSMFQTLLSALR